MVPRHIARDTEYKEISSTLRHYSNLRFLIIPLYFTINAGMLVGFQNDKLRDVPYIYVMVGALPILLAWVFVIMEYLLNKNIERFVSCAVKLAPGGHWASRPKPIGILTCSLIVLYIAVACCWLSFAYHLYTANRFTYQYDDKTTLDLATTS